MSLHIELVSPRMHTLAVLALLVSLASAEAAPDVVRVYVNERYGYSIAYPADFIPQGVSDAGDEQVLVSPAGDAELRVFARACVEGIDSTTSEYVAGYEQQQKAGALTVTYSRKGKQFGVVSGRKNGQMFYDKILISDDWCTQFKFEFAANRSGKYNAIAKRTALSFRR